MDFEQLAFIERWRQRALRGVVVALDGTRGDLLVTVRVGELGERVDLRGRDATGSARRARLAIGDRVTVAIEYVARDVEAGAAGGLAGGLVAPGAMIEGTVLSPGELIEIDCGVHLLVREESMPGVRAGDAVRFTIAEEGKLHLIPTR